MEFVGVAVVFIAIFVGVVFVMGYISKQRDLKYRDINVKHESDSGRDWLTHLKEEGVYKNVRLVTWKTFCKNEPERADRLMNHGLGKIYVVGKYKTNAYYETPVATYATVRADIKNGSPYFEYSYTPRTAKTFAFGTSAQAKVTERVYLSFEDFNKTWFLDDKHAYYALYLLVQGKRPMDGITESDMNEINYGAPIDLNSMM